MKLKMKMTSKEKNYVALILGISLAMLYKAWKIYCLTSLKLNNYEDQQVYFTFYRIAAALAAYFIINSNYKESLNFLKNFADKKSILFVTTYSLMFFALLYFSWNGFTFIPKAFIFESFINTFVGGFEEFIFRGILFLSLRTILGCRWSIFISAILFSIWHYDVLPNDVLLNSVVGYTSIFLFGVMSAFLVEKSFNFTYLVLLHALRDIIFFGLIWNNYIENNTYLCSLIAFDFLFLIFSYYLFRKETTQS